MRSIRADLSRFPCSPNGFFRLRPQHLHVASGTQQAEAAFQVVGRRVRAEDQRIALQSAATHLATKDISERASNGERRGRTGCGG